jgi:hypothetical protein
VAVPETFVLTVVRPWPLATATAVRPGAVATADVAARPATFVPTVVWAGAVATTADVRAGATVTPDLARVGTVVVTLVRAGSPLFTAGPETDEVIVQRVPSQSSTPP